MNRNQIVPSSSSSNLIDSKLHEEHQISIPNHCPSCGHKIQKKPDWLGLPAGVKFDPTDQELIEHLEAKVSTQVLSSHPLIDEFILTIEGEDGICYTHPEKLPGVRRDGLSKHFFHRPSKAYTTGTRKRRKIQTECDVQCGETRWHKTGKTRPVAVNGKQKGCKKILVLYTNFGKHRKPEKTNWVMHQYHLGEMEEEKEGELVVSKIFYQTQPRQCSLSSERMVGDRQRRKDSGNGSGSCGSSKEVVMNQLDSFRFGPFRKSFDEAALGETNATHSTEESNDREGRKKHDHHPHHQQQAAAASAAFHISRPTNSISAIISPPTLNHESMVFEDPYHVSRSIFLHTDKFHKHQEEQHKVLERSAGAGLEELIRGCSSANLMKAETSLPHTQETEWLKYSYWSPDSHDHHG